MTRRLCARCFIATRMTKRESFPVFCFWTSLESNCIGKPFARELIIEHATTPESFYSKEDGAGKELPPVEQLTGLKLRYFPPGASPSTPSIPTTPLKKAEKRAEKTPSKKSEKKEKKEKKSKK